MLHHRDHRKHVLAAAQCTFPQLLPPLRQAGNTMQMKRSTIQSCHLSGPLNRRHTLGHYQVPALENGRKDEGWIGTLMRCYCSQVAPGAWSAPEPRQDPGADSWHLRVFLRFWIHSMPTSFKRLLENWTGTWYWVLSCLDW